MVCVSLLRRCPGPNRRQEAEGCAACLTLLTALSGSSTPPTDLVGAAIFSTRTRSIRGISFFRPDMAACFASFSSLGSPLVAEKLVGALLGVVMQRIAPGRLGFHTQEGSGGWTAHCTAGIPCCASAALWIGSAVDHSASHQLKGSYTPSTSDRQRLDHPPLKAGALWLLGGTILFHEIPSSNRRRRKRCRLH